MNLLTVIARHRLKNLYQFFFRIEVVFQRTFISRTLYSYINWAIVDGVLEIRRQSKKVSPFVQVNQIFPRA